LERAASRRLASTLPRPWRCRLGHDLAGSKALPRPTFTRYRSRDQQAVWTGDGRNAPWRRVDTRRSSRASTARSRRSRPRCSPRPSCSRATASGRRTPRRDDYRDLDVKGKVCWCSVAAPGAGWRTGDLVARYDSPDSVRQRYARRSARRVAWRTCRAGHRRRTTGRAARVECRSPVAPFFVAFDDRGMKAPPSSGCLHRL